MRAARDATPDGDPATSAAASAHADAPSDRAGPAEAMMMAPGKGRRLAPMESYTVSFRVVQPAEADGEAARETDALKNNATAMEAALTQQLHDEGVDHRQGRRRFAHRRRRVRRC